MRVWWAIAIKFVSLVALVANTHPFALWAGKVAVVEIYGQGFIEIKSHEGYKVRHEPVYWQKLEIGLRTCVLVSC